MSDTVVDDARASCLSHVRARTIGETKEGARMGPPAKGDASGDDVLARINVLAAMGDMVEDETTLREAEELATKWLVDPTSVNADTAPVALALASRKAGATRLGELRTAAKNAKTRDDRVVGASCPRRLRRARSPRGSVGRDPRGRGAGERDSLCLSTVFARRNSRPLAEAWVRNRWDALRKKLPGSLSAVLVQAAGVGCSSGEAEERDTFYTPRTAQIEGTARWLAASLESISICSALRERGAPVLTKALLGTKK